MTPGHKATERIRQAERRVRAVADGWNSVNLQAIGNCVSALECSAADLSHGIEILRSSPATGGSPFRQDLLDLKRTITRLQRLVDSSAAFLRSAPGLASGDAGVYQAGGSIRYLAPPPVTPGFQV
jgi:hypothetical protein